MKTILFLLTIALAANSYSQNSSKVVDSYLVKTRGDKHSDDYGRFREYRQVIVILNFEGKLIEDSTKVQYVILTSNLLKKDFPKKQKDLLSFNQMKDVLDEIKISKAGFHIQTREEQEEMYKQENSIRSQPISGYGNPYSNNPKDYKSSNGW